MNDNDPEIEYSPLCEKVTRDGVTMNVQIYRLAVGDDGWSLEVIDEEGASTVWGDRFCYGRGCLSGPSRKRALKRYCQRSCDCQMATRAYRLAEFNSSPPPPNKTLKYWPKIITELMCCHFIASFATVLGAIRKVQSHLKPT